MSAKNTRTRLSPGQAAQALAEIIRNARLIWRLLWDSRVSPWPKLLIPGAILYVLSPIDFLPDLFLGLGQLDDLAMFLLALKLFVELCPRDIVRQHQDDLRSYPGEYHVVVEGEGPAQTNESVGYIDVPYRVLEKPDVDEARPEKRNSHAPGS